MAEEKQEQRTAEDVSVKKRSLALLLCILYGWLGLHRFYAGKVGTGLAMMLTFGGLGIWYFIDIIWIISGTFEDNEGKVIYDWY
jgi:TM2 domain-containing membrane protein YozV